MPRVTNEFFVNIVQGLVKPTIINLLTVENNCLVSADEFLGLHK